MDQVLVVEDSQFVGSLIKKKIEADLKLPVKWVKNYQDAIQIIDEKKDDFLVSLLDLHLPDAADGQIVDYALSKSIPSIVITGEFSNQQRKKIWKKKIVDYVLKESSDRIDYIVSLVNRINKNRTTKVLLVDDSKVSRKIVSGMLRVHQYIVYEAYDGVEALEILSQHPDLSMVITDYNMPRMDGFHLIEKIREKYSSKRLAIIGISANSDTALSARFIKKGANDFITKPFSSEEFYCRITQNIEMLEYIRKISDLSNKDNLTDIYNRRYFYDVSRKLHANAKRDSLSVTIAIVDIDNFREINDFYGHQVGDTVLKRFSDILQSRFRQSDVVCRFSGEEFCILATDMDRGKTFEIFDRLRAKIAGNVITVEDHQIQFTISVGICTILLDSLEEMIDKADKMVNMAKKAGGNKAMIM